MDFFDEYINPLIDQPEQRLDDVTDDKVAQGRVQFEGVMNQIPAPDLAESQAAKLRGARFPEQQDLMYQIAAGLRACKAKGIDLGLNVTPEQIETIAAQDMSVGGVLKAIEVIGRGADTGILLCAREADVALTSTFDALRAMSADPTVSDADKAAVSFAFAEPVRLVQEAKERAAPVEDEAEVQHQQRLKQLLQKGNLKELIAAFEAAVASPADGGLGGATAGGVSAGGGSSAATGGGAPGLKPGKSKRPTLH